MRIPFFRDAMPRHRVIGSRSFETTWMPHLQTPKNVKEEFDTSMLEDEANTLSRNVGSRLPNAAASHPERTEFLATSP
jgi:hypothetical protein